MSRKAYAVVRPDPGGRPSFIGWVCPGCSVERSALSLKAALTDVRDHNARFGHG